jgi:hypothetical protein
MPKSTPKRKSMETIPWDAIRITSSIISAVVSIAYTLYQYLN